MLEAAAGETVSGSAGKPLLGDAGEVGRAVSMRDIDGIADGGARDETVAQPPPAVPVAKTAKAAYQRNLPHVQRPGQTLFVTFRTGDQLILADDARDLVLHHCLHDHERKLRMHGAVVMPNHVHLVFTPSTDSRGRTFGLAEILNGIKGASAHSVNRLLGRNGNVWQDESFDHVLRSTESLREKVEYICQNPIRAGLVSDENDYRWLWREWIEGANTQQ